MINQRQIKNFEVDTISKMKLLTGRTDEICYCAETSTFYRFTNSSVATDDLTVVDTSSGGLTRWIGVAGKYTYLLNEKTYDALNSLSNEIAGLTTADIADSINKRYISDAEKTVVQNTSGINTGDGKTTAINSPSGTGTGTIYKTKSGTELVFKKIKAGTNVTITNDTDDITISASGTGGSAVDSVNGETGIVVLTQDDIGNGINYSQFSNADKTKLNGIATGANVGVVPNTAITGATKTKITYDSKGLITSGTDATTADIADSLNKRYITDAQKTVIQNTSGTNTGDETASTIKTKLGITTLSGSNTGDETNATIKSKLGITTLSGSNTGDQDLSGLVPNTRTVNGYALSSNITIPVGETNTASNSVSGTGTGSIFKNKSGVDLVFKKIKAGTNVTVTNDTDDITINSTGVTGTSIATEMLNATENTTIADTDIFSIRESSSGLFKKINWQNIKSVIKTWFDSLSTTFSNKSISLGSNTITGTTAQFNAALTDGDFATLNGIESITGLKTFDKEKLAVKGTSTGVNIISVANTSATNYNNALPAKSGTFAMTDDISVETQATLLSKLGISTLSGSNTGDETVSTIKSKLGISTLSGSNTGDETNATLLSKLGLTSISGTNTGDETAAGIRTKLGITTLSGSNTGDETTSSILTKIGDGSKVSSAYLPSYVDDVIESANYAALPATGEAGKIYIALDTNKAYRWSGSVYVELSSGVALGTTSSTAFRGDYGQTAYNHSQASGNPHGATTANINSSTDKRYVTDAQLTVIGNTSGTNTGDETAAGIRTKLGITTLSGDNTGDETASTIKTKLGITTLSGSNTGDQINVTGSSGSCTGNSATSTKTTNLIGGNGTTLLGSIPYQSNTDTTSFIQPNTLSTKKYLTQTGLNGNGDIPVWDTISELYGDVNVVGSSKYFTANFGDAISGLQFKNNITNGNTVLGVVPNGTATEADVYARSNSSLSNSSKFIGIKVNPTEALLYTSHIVGAIPLSIYVNGSNRMTIGIDGNVSFTGNVSATNISGSNTGDETAETIFSKLGISGIEHVVGVTSVTGINTGDQTSIVGITGTTAQFNNALTDDNFCTLAGSETLTNKIITNPRGTVITNASATGTVTPDFGAGDYFNYTLTGNITLANPTNIVAGTTKQFLLKQDATGSRTITFGTNYKFAGGADKALTTSANAEDVLTVTCINGSTMQCTLMKAFS